MRLFKLTSVSIGSGAENKMDVEKDDGEVDRSLLSDQALISGR